MSFRAIAGWFGGATGPGGSSKPTGAAAPPPPRRKADGASDQSPPAEEPPAKTRRRGLWRRESDQAFDAPAPWRREPANAPYDSVLEDDFSASLPLVNSSWVGAAALRRAVVGLDVDPGEERLRIFAVQRPPDRLALFALGGEDWRLSDWGVEAVEGAARRSDIVAGLCRRLDALRAAVEEAAAGEPFSDLNAIWPRADALCDGWGTAAPGAEGLAGSETEAALRAVDMTRLRQVAARVGAPLAIGSAEARAPALRAAALAAYAARAPLGHRRILVWDVRAVTGDAVAHIDVVSTPASHRPPAPWLAQIDPMRLEAAPAAIADAARHGRPSADAAPPPNIAARRATDATDMAQAADAASFGEAYPPSGSAEPIEPAAPPTPRAPADEGLSLDAAEAMARRAGPHLEDVHAEARRQADTILRRGGAAMWRDAASRLSRSSDAAALLLASALFSAKADPMADAAAFEILCRAVGDAEAAAGALAFACFAQCAYDRVRAAARAPSAERVRAALDAASARLIDRVSQAAASVDTMPIDDLDLWVTIEALETLAALETLDPALDRAFLEAVDLWRLALEIATPDSVMRLAPRIQTGATSSDALLTARLLARAALPEDSRALLPLALVAPGRDALARAKEAAKRLSPRASSDRERP